MIKPCIYFVTCECFRSSCSVFDCVTGNVTVCEWYRGGDMSASRRVGFSRVSVFSKHVVRRKGGGFDG